MLGFTDVRMPVIRRFMMGSLLFITTAVGMAAGADASVSQVGAGISHDLARSRAKRVSGVRYRLQFTLVPHANTVDGHEWLTFDLSPHETAHDLPLDFRQGKILDARLNGSALPGALTDGHLELKAGGLRAGTNTVEITFTARVAAAGSALTRFEDKEDGSEYIYSLFVPMDASSAFPCFDQPDLKARFTLRIDAPATWTVISNTAGTRKEASGTSIWNFAQTKPISTYLFAFAAGPWTTFPGKPGEPSVYVRRSQHKRAESEIPQLQSITARGMVWLADYFQQPFPFPKYDIVLIPGFPFGGMEHAGATFLNEDGVLFRTAPTASDRFHRNILTLHELTHQWFGDLVTMRWFDDLWLKEGFAQYMAYRCLDALEPDSQAWKHFYEDIKPPAYSIDETEGTTPIFQDIPNLTDAKSAYGAIVYEKAPAILKQLEFRLGPDDFRNGLRLYLKQHAYGNARWSDLIEAFHTASGQDVRTWADAWVLRRGMPEITTTWTCDAQGRLAELKLHQRDVLPDGLTWPISNEVRLEPAGDSVRVNWSTPEFTVREAAGKACPQYVFANAGDYAYGRFLLDAASERAVRQTIVPPPATASAHITNPALSPLLRSMLWGALWDDVHVAESSPRGYVDLVLRNLPAEGDETLSRIQGNHAVTALHRYFTGNSRAPLAAQLEQVTTDRMLHAPALGLRIVNFRTLTAVAETPEGRSTLKQLLAGTLTIPGVALRPLDRWNLIEALIAQSDPDAHALFAAEAQQDHSGDAQKFAFASLAATPTAAIKQKYFAEYTLSPSDSKAKPEDWLSQSLRPFNSWNQTSLTEPYLRTALDQLPEIKRDRKIFYLGVWLDAFLGDQISSEAEVTVKQWLARPNIDADLRRKVLENADELERTVLIRQKFPDGGAQ
jgi:aminopeptidase N